MANTKHVVVKDRESVQLGALDLVGDDRNADIGLRIHIPFGAAAKVDSLRVRNCFINLVKTGDGFLDIDSADWAEFGGDGFNIRGSNVRIGRLKIRDNTPTRSYDEYHQDAIGQMYAVKADGFSVDPDGVIENVVISDLDAEISGEDCQGLMLSEACEYRGIFIGDKRYRVVMGGYPYHFVANTLSRSKIGCESGCELSEGSALRIENVKGAAHSSDDVQVLGMLERDVVAPDAEGLQFVGNGPIVVKDTSEAERSIRTPEPCGDLGVVMGGQEGLFGNSNLPLFSLSDEALSKRGIRNCNPGNIEDSPSNRWVGLASAAERTGKQVDEDRFCVFTDHVYGIRALAITLQNYQSRHKLKSIKQIISRYAPRQDSNNTDVYIDVVAKSVGVAADAVVSMRDYKTLYNTVVAIVEHENGVANPYPDFLIEQGLAMSRVDMPNEPSSVDVRRRSKEFTRGSTVVVGSGSVGAIAVAERVLNEPEAVLTEVVDTVKDGAVEQIEVIKASPVAEAGAWYSQLNGFEVAQLVLLAVIALAALDWMLDRRLTKRLGIR